MEVSMSSVVTRGAGHETINGMFDRFTAASARLSERHESLSLEIASLHERLRLKDEELARAERLSTLGATAAALAHEVRNPLGSIKLFLSLLREDTAANAGATKTINAIERSVSNLDHVVSNMLQFAADKPCRLQLCSVMQVLEDVAKQICAEHGEFQISLMQSFLPEHRSSAATRVMFDESALRSIVSNLWRNAGQAQRWKGRVETEVEFSNEYWGFTVRDFGPGISALVLPKLFEPFVTGRQEGTGLGLAIVRRLVEQHSGTILARNLNDGAVFEAKFLKGVL